MKRDEGDQLSLDWHVNDQWDLNFGYRGLDRRIETDDLKDRFTFDNAIFTVGYRFGA